MSSEARFEFFPEAKHGKYKNSTPPTLFYTTKTPGKLTELNIILPFTNWQRSIPLWPPLLNAHIALWHKNQHLQNLHVKMCKLYLHHYLYELSFWCYQHQVIYLMRLWIVQILPPYSFTWDNVPWNKSSKDHPFQTKVILSWCQFFDVKYAVHYCTEGHVQSLNKEKSSLTQCQWIYVLCAVQIYT